MRQRSSDWLWCRGGGCDEAMALKLNSCDWQTGDTVNRLWGGGLGVDNLSGDRFTSASAPDDLLIHHHTLTPSPLSHHTFCVKAAPPSTVLLPAISSLLLTSFSSATSFPPPISLVLNLAGV